MSTLEFEDLKEEIGQLYLEENRSLKQVIKELEQRRNFHRTERAYKERLKKWGWRKNVKHSEIAPFLSGLRLREPDEAGRRQRSYRIQGHEMSRQKVRWHWNLDRKKREAQETDLPYDPMASSLSLTTTSTMDHPPTPSTAMSALSGGYSTNCSTIDLDETMDEARHPDHTVRFPNANSRRGSEYDYPFQSPQHEVLKMAIKAKTGMDFDEQMRYLFPNGLPRDMPQLPLYSESSPAHTVLASTPIDHDKSVYVAAPPASSQQPPPSIDAPHEMDETAEAEDQVTPLHQTSVKIEAQASRHDLNHHHGVQQTSSHYPHHTSSFTGLHSMPLHSLPVTDPYSSLPVPLSAMTFGGSSSSSHYDSHTPYASGSVPSSAPFVPSSYPAFPNPTFSFNDANGGSHHDSYSSYGQSSSSSATSMSASSSRTGSDNSSYQDMLPQAFGGFGGFGQWPS